MKAVALSLLFFVQTGFANNFKQKPQEVTSFEVLFSNLLIAKKIELPQRYDQHSKLIKKDGYERIYTVVNNNCENDDLFMGEIWRTHANDIIQELLVYNCSRIEDGVKFYRMGPNLKALNSESLINLDFQALLDQEILDLEVGQAIALTVFSFELEFLYQKVNHYQQTLTITKKTDNFNYKLVFKKTKYVNDEVWWQFDLYTTSEKTNSSDKNHTQFLTKSKQSPFEKGVYRHERYFNGKLTVPFVYNNHFKQVILLINELFKSDTIVSINLPKMD